MAHALYLSVQRMTSAWALASVHRILVLAPGVACLALASWLHVPFAQTPVPFTWQPQAVLLVSSLLGPGLAEATVLSWLAAAAAGAPVLAGLSGPMAFIGPSAGYLWAYLPVSWVMARFGRQAGLYGLLVWLAANATILVAGTAWLAVWAGARAALQLGLAPFIVADAAKVAVVFVLLARLRPRFS